MAMPAPVKISDRLLARAKAEAKGAHRSVTAQIEHWAMLGRAVEVMTGHREVLALKRVGEHLAMPPYVSPQAIHDLLVKIGNDPDREAIKAEIRAAGTPIYSGDPDDPDAVIQIATDGRRTRGRFEDGTFVPASRAGKRDRERSVLRVAARRRR
jgi:ParD-like antitoxin of type II ParDE toxin-antitoxin system